MNQQLKNEKELHKKDATLYKYFKFPKGTRPPTLSMLFRNATSDFADNHLIPERDFGNLLAKVAFLKEHPDINEVLLDYATTTTIMADKNNLAKDIPSPAEVRKILRYRVGKLLSAQLNLIFQMDDVFFDKKDIENITQGGNDYNLYMY